MPLTKTKIRGITIGNKYSKFIRYWSALPMNARTKVGLREVRGENTLLKSRGLQDSFTTWPPYVKVWLNLSSTHTSALLLASFRYSSFNQLDSYGFPNALSRPTNLSVVIFIIFIANINHHWNIGRSMRNKNINIQKSYHKLLNIQYTTSHACSDFWDIYPRPLYCVYNQFPPRKVL